MMINSFPFEFEVDGLVTVSFESAPHHPDVPIRAAYFIITIENP